MGNLRKFRVLIRAILIVGVFTIAAGSLTARAEKLPPPERPVSGATNADLPLSAGTEVWVETADVQRGQTSQTTINQFTPSLLAPSTTIVINEFDQFNDDVEFFNLSASPVDLSNWIVRIYIGANSLYSTYLFPAGFVLNAGAYVVLHENGDPLDNTAADLYAGDNLAIQTLGGAIVLSDGTDTAVDFVRWNIATLPPPAGTGWAGTNPYLPEEVEFSLGRNASSLDQDLGEDWGLQVPSYGAQNDPNAPLCVQFWPVFSGNGAAPTYFPSQSAGCELGYFVPGEVILVTANPDPGWEVGQWEDGPATEYLGTDLSFGYTITLEHDYLWLSYIHSNPVTGSVLLIGLWGDYSYTLEDLAVPYDQINGHTYAPDWEVLNRYDLVIYQGFDGEPFYINLRGSNYSAYLDGGGCMWVEADVFDQEPEEIAPNIPYAYFGIDSYGASYLADSINGIGSLYSGIGPFDDPADEYYVSLTPYNIAEAAFEDISGYTIGVTKSDPNYTSGWISFNFNNLAQLEQGEILGPFLDACSIPHSGYDFPSNDDFDSPYVIPNLDYSNTQGALSILQATIAGDDPKIYTEQRARSVWYQYTSGSDRDIKVDTYGSNYDTMVAVWTGSRGSLSLVAVNDDANNSQQSDLVFSASAGTTYYIEVASYNAYDYGTLVLNVTAFGGLLFESDFEEGNLLEWTRFNDGKGFLTACTEAAINGTYGACVERGTNDKRKQLIDDTPGYETTFAARFNFDINNLSMTTGERFRFMQFKMDALRPAFIVLKYQSGQYYIQLNTLLDDLTKVKSSWIVLPNAATTIEVEWQQSSGADDGYARLYLDDALQDELTGLDNDTISITSFRMGFTSRLVGKSISGIFYIDDVVTSSGGHIGLP